MLHRVGRRRATGRLRHARPPHRRTPGHHARGSAGGAARPLGRRVRRSTGRASAASARRASSCGWPRSKAPSRARHRRGATSRRPCAPTCAAARAGSPSSRPPAARWASTARRARPPAIPANPVLAAWRAQVEGPAFQSSGPDVVLGGGGFADDSAPPDALVQLGADATARPRPPRRPGRERARPGPQQHGAAVAPGRAAGRATGRSPCRRPGSSPPTSSRTPAGAAPAARPASPLANGGAFGGKRHSPVPAGARELADETGDAVRVLWRREDVVRRGPKRPPLAVALRADGTGVVRVGRTRRLGRPGAAGGRACGRCCPGVRGRGGRGGRTAGVARPARRGLGRGAGGAGRARAARPAPRARRGARRRARGGQARVELHLGDGVARPGRGRRVGGRGPLSR